MAHGLGPALDSGARFPDMEWNWLDAGRRSLSSITGGGWGVLLIYRGDW